RVEIGDARARTDEEVHSFVLEEEIAQLFEWPLVRYRKLLDEGCGQVVAVDLTKARSERCRRRRKLGTERQEPRQRPLSSGNDVTCRNRERHALRKQTAVAIRETR